MRSQTPPQQLQLLIEHPQARDLKIITKARPRLVNMLVSRVVVRKIITNPLVALHRNVQLQKKVVIKHIQMQRKMKVDLLAKIKMKVARKKAVPVAALTKVPHL